MAEISSSPSTVSVVTIALTSSWLKDPIGPSNNITVSIRSIDPETRSRNEQVFQPLGLPFPTIVQGVRQSGRGALTILVTTQAQINALNTLLEPARTLLLQYPNDTATGPVFSSYVRLVGDTSTARLVQVRGRPHRELTLNYVEVARP